MHKPNICVQLKGHKALGQMRLGETCSALNCEGCQIVINRTL